MARHGGYVSTLIVGSLIVGMAGYHWIADQSWVDAFLNTSMLLGGMGPVGDLHTDAAKIFAGLFALYSGFEVLVVVATMLAPVFHRMIHHFHWEEDTKESS